MATAPNHARTIQWLETTSQWLGKRSALAHGQAQELKRASDSMQFTAPVADRVRHTVAGTVANLDSIVRFLHDLSLYTRKEARRLADLDARARTLAAQAQGGPVAGLAPATAESALYAVNPEQWALSYFPAEQGLDLVLIGEGVDQEWTTIGASPGGYGGRVAFDMPSVRFSADVFARIARALQDHQTAMLRQLHTVPDDMSRHLHGSLGRTRRDLPAKFEREAARLTRQASLLVRRMSIEDLLSGVTLTGPVPLVPPGYVWADPVGWDRMRRPLYEDILQEFIDAVALIVRPHLEWDKPVPRRGLLPPFRDQEAAFREAVCQFVEAVGLIRSFTNGAPLPTWPPRRPGLPIEVEPNPADPGAPIDPAATSPGAEPPEGSFSPPSGAGGAGGGGGGGGGGAGPSFRASSVPAGWQEAPFSPARAQSTPTPGRKRRSRWSPPKRPS